MTIFKYIDSTIKTLYIYIGKSQALNLNKGKSQMKSGEYISIAKKARHTTESLLWSNQ